MQFLYGVHRFQPIKQFRVFALSFLGLAWGLRWLVSTCYWFLRSSGTYTLQISNVGFKSIKGPEQLLFPFIKFCIVDLEVSEMVDSPGEKFITTILFQIILIFNSLQSGDFSGQLAHVLIKDISKLFFGGSLVKLVEHFVDIQMWNLAVVIGIEYIKSDLF